DEPKDDELEDAKFEDNILALCLDITVRIFFFFMLDIDYLVTYVCTFTIFGLMLHHTYGRYREKKFMGNQLIQ
ncbi:5788_t:CDS:1, partial [Dentiscutata heterogama]